MPTACALIAEFLEANDAWCHTAFDQLSRRLQQEPNASGQMLCHRPDGLYVLLPRRLAEHLLTALSMVREAQVTT